MKKLSGLLAIVLLLSIMLTSCNRDPKESGGDSSTNNPVSMAGPDENAVDALDFSGVFDNDFFEGYEKMDLDVSKSYYTLLSVANHLTWSIQVGGTTAGSALTLTPFVHNIGQVFEIQEVEGGNIVLKSLATGLVIAAKVPKRQRAAVRGVCRRRRQSVVEQESGHKWLFYPFQ